MPQSPLEQLQQKKPELLKIAEKHGVSNIRVFGSVARGEERPYSDIDLLVHMYKGKDLFDLIGFKIDAQEMLGHKLDVLSYGGVHRLLCDRIYSEAVSL